MLRVDDPDNHSPDNHSPDNHSPDNHDNHGLVLSPYRIIDIDGDDARVEAPFG